MSNAVYQTTVEQLEAVLSPRVVSRSLQEGLRQLGRSPDTVDYAAVEQILKAQIYRQLQVTMPVTQAKKTIQDILDHVQGATDAGDDTAAASPSEGLERQAQRVASLKAALKPYNLYFEWPEVQKLRAQIQLLEAEQEAEREATSLVDAAEAQLSEVEQKLEDQLVLQARELGELQEALEQVRTLGGAKVRRLESLVNHVGEAQTARQLATAEVERARRLARDLRKLMESSVYSEEGAAEADGGGPPMDAPAAPAAVESTDRAGGVATVDDLAAADLPPAVSGAPEARAAEAAPEEDIGEAWREGSATPSEDGPPVPEESLPGAGEVRGRAGAAPMGEAGAEPMDVDAGLLDVDAEEEDLLSIDSADLDPELGARLLLLDLEGERHDLEVLAKEYGTVLPYVPELQQQLEALRRDLDEDRTVADRLEALRHTLAEAFEAQRATLVEELETVEAGLGDLRPEVDTSELRQGLRVALGILSTTLPTRADIDHLRDQHRLALERAEEFARAEEEANSQREAQLREQAAILDRLESTLVRYEGQTAAEEEYRRLKGEVEALREAHTQDAFAPELLDKVRRAEASLESAMAVMADARIDRQRARLRTLLAEVQALPGLETVSARISSVVTELERQLTHLERDTLDDAQVEAAASLVDALRDDARASVQRKLETLAEQATRVGSPALLERIRRGMEGLDDHRYPDLQLLQAALKQEREAQRDEQLAELHVLEREAHRYAGLDTPTFARLQQRLDEARERLGAGGLASGLVQARTLLEQVGAEVDARLRDLEPRLDRALERFHTVEKLNSDDVASARRILTHLDSQRDALPRISVGLRLQLEGALSEAEGLLDKLAEEYDATRAIADQLVHANVLDDVFGLFGDDAPPPSPEPTADPDATLRSYREEPEVLGAAWLDDTGRVLAGALPWSEGDRRAVVAALLPLAGAAASIAGGTATLATVEHPDGALLVGWPDARRPVVVALASRSDLTVLANRLRRDLPALSGAQAAPAHENEGGGPEADGAPSA